MCQLLLGAKIGQSITVIKTAAILAQSAARRRRPAWDQAERRAGLARIEMHGKLLMAARDDAALILSRDPDLASPRGEALRHLFYPFERDEAIRLLRAG
jgi:hypothetical protein